MAVVEHGGVTRAYALDHVIHHHIINDHFGDRLVALTYSWDLRGKRLTGDGADLEPVAVSDEYWFSWKRFHPTTKLVRS